MKRNPEELIEEISDILVVYLKSGKIGLNSFINKVHLNISQLEELLEIHFLLKEEVKTFVKELPILIRRFKTSTTVHNETQHGEVRGQINWSNTIKERLKINARDKTIFSVNERNRNYDIKENIVLKEFLHILHKILFQTIDVDHFEKFHWFEEWGDLKSIIDQVLRENIYLSRMSSHRSNLSDRMIQETTKHRNPLYSGAANLLLLYRKLLAKSIDEELIKELLRETFVFPEQEDVLYELYWVVQLIKYHTENAEIQLLDSRNNLVASWQDEKFKYNIFHDSTGSKNIIFDVSLDEVKEHPHPYVSQKAQAIEVASQVSIENFGQSFDTKSFWNGRPDIVVEIFDKETNALRKVIIGEVKYTKSVEYTITGLRELLDYMKLVKDRNGTYLDGSDNVEVAGMLFSDSEVRTESDLSYLLSFDFNKHVGNVKYVSSY